MTCLLWANAAAGCNFGGLCRGEVYFVCERDAWEPEGELCYTPSKMVLCNHLTLNSADLCKHRDTAGVTAHDPLGFFENFSFFLVLA